MYGNVDLMNRASEILKRLPVRSLDIRLSKNSDGSHDVTVSTGGFSRLDVYLNERLQQSLDGTTKFTLQPLSSGVSILSLEGFEKGELIAALRSEL